MFKPFTRRSFLVSSTGAAIAQALPVRTFAMHSTESTDQRHVWEKIEVSLTANQNFPNPYADVIVWVDLTGPGFNKRVYGFWDGDKPSASG